MVAESLLARTYQMRVFEKQIYVNGEKQMRSKPTAANGTAYIGLGGARPKFPQSTHQLTARRLWSPV